MTPMPEWVKARNTDYSAEPPQANRGGFDFLLYDNQLKTGSNTPAHYLRKVVRVNSLQAIEKFSRVRLAYAPAYQGYEMHHIRVYRNQTTLDKLATAQVNFNTSVAAEGSPEHEGMASVDIYMADIRKGDIIDIAYSVTGHNEAFGNRILGAINLAGMQGARNLHWRLVAPADRSVTLLYHGEQLEPDVVRTENNIEYEWFREEADHIELEYGVPDWISQFPVVSFSDFTSWLDVRDWGIEFFTLSPEETESVSELAAKILGEEKDPIQQLIALTAYMRSEIRYVGMEIGRNAYRPHTPDLVAERRYGDCKDQAMLLVALLRNAGIDAWPALVNSKGATMMELRGPSPLGFDHVITYVEIGGKQYWIDPTIALPEGFEPDLLVPPYEKALLLRQGQIAEILGLATQVESSVGQIFIEDTFDFANGFDTSGKWTRVTTYRDQQAVFIGNQIDAIGELIFRQQIEEYRKKKFYNVSVATPAKVSVENNILTVTESYTLQIQEGSDAFNYKPIAIKNNLRWPKINSTRQFPFALTYPLMIDIKATIKSDDLAVDEAEHEVNSDYRTYERRVIPGDGILELRYRYETHKEFVPAEDVESYATETADISTRLNYKLDWDSDKGEITASSAMPSMSGYSLQEMHDLNAKLEKFIDNPNNTAQDRRDLLLEIVDSPTISTSLKRNLLKSYPRSGPLEEFVFILDNQIKVEGGVFHQTFEERAKAYASLGMYDKAYEDLRTAMTLITDKNMIVSPGMLDKARDFLWRLKDHSELVPVLRKLVDASVNPEQYHRELIVVLDLLGEKDMAKQARKDMRRAGFKPLPALPLQEDMSYQRNPRAVFQVQPPYPELAKQLNIEGVVVAEFTILENGTVEGCKIIEANPPGYFDDAACKTASSFVYYPPLKGEAGGNVEGWKIRFTFGLKD